MIKNSKQFILGVLFFLPLFIVSCSDVPGPIGSDLVSDQGVEKGMLIDSTHSKNNTVVVHSPLGTTATFLLGRNSEAEALALLKFIPANSALKDRLAAGKIVIDTALVTLTRTYKLGAEPTSFNFQGFRILNDWNSTTINYDTLVNKVQYGSQNIVSSYGGTDTASTRFFLNKSMVLDWMNAAVNDSFATKNYGFLLTPPAGANTILGFEGLTDLYTNPPALRIAYHDADSTADSPRFFVVNTDADAHTLRLLDSTRYASSENIVLQNGIIRDARIWFDYNALPSNIIIHHCELILTKKDTLYQYTESPNYVSDVRAYYLSDSTGMSVNVNYTSKFSVTDDKFTADVTSIVSTFVAAGQHINIGLFSSNRYLGANGLVFYGSNAADLSKRPKLKIIYSRREK